MEFNHTNITLIPKIESPTLVTHYRPISLCNVAYKIIAKLLANRLQLVIHKILSHSQSAFVPGRRIQDNIILVNEIMPTLKKKRGRGGLMALKIDIEKAYDKVDWGFLLEIMRCCGFFPFWFQMISQYISTSSFSILLNGSPFCFFKPHRGLRQGDPLSPFLFILVMEGLTRLIAKAKNDNRMHGIKIARQAPPITHLLFADDLMVFFRAN